MCFVALIDEDEEKDVLEKLFLEKKIREMI